MYQVLLYKYFFYLFGCYVTVFQVKKQLFGLDNRGIGSDVAMKNELRRTIKVRRP